MESVETRIRNLIKEGVFGAVEFGEIIGGSDDGLGSHVMSEVMFFRLYLLEGGVKREIPIFVKVQIKDKERIKDLRTDIQFANEVKMYGEILPGLGAFHIGVASKMLYGNATKGQDRQKDIIITEDLRSSDYRIAHDLFLDYDHVALTIRKLGEYHSLSYKMKQEFPKTFEEFCNILQPREFKLVDGFFEGSLYRGFEQMIENSMVKDAYKKLLDVLMKKTNKSLNHPDEPFAVISHGDFNRNNLMYKYDDDGRVAGVIFIDFANSVYSDPSRDISFFLYMNTSDELRQAHWDDFLATYWEGVTSFGDPGFTYEEFLKNFAKRAIWGYIPCCFFLPMMMFPDLLREKDNKEPSFEEKRTFGMTAGGEKATAAVSAIVRHLLDKCYLEEFACNL